MYYPCAKFGDSTFSRFGFIVRTNTDRITHTHTHSHTDADYCYTHAAHSVSPIFSFQCSLPLSDFIIVFFPHCIYCFLCLFLCLLSTIIVQPLAITFNKRYRFFLNNNNNNKLRSVTLFVLLCNVQCEWYSDSVTV